MSSKICVPVPQSCQNASVASSRSQVFGCARGIIPHHLLPARAQCPPISCVDFHIALSHPNTGYFPFLSFLPSFALLSFLTFLPPSPLPPYHPTTVDAVIIAAPSVMADEGSFVNRCVFAPKQVQCDIIYQHKKFIRQRERERERASERESVCARARVCVCAKQEVLARGSAYTFWAALYPALIEFSRQKEVFFFSSPLASVACVVAPTD